MEWAPSSAEVASLYGALAARCDHTALVNLTLDSSRSAGPASVSFPQSNIDTLRRLFGFRAVREVVLSVSAGFDLGNVDVEAMARYPVLLPGNEFGCTHLRYSTRPELANNTDVSHSEFLADSSAGTSWKENKEGYMSGGNDSMFDDGLSAGKGKLSPTASHLFKLILPLGKLSDKHTVSKSKAQKRTPPTVILLHPSQPLSHVSRLILASLAPATPNISFRSSASSGQQVQWSDSTDVGDFIRDAARHAEFSICISYDASSNSDTSEGSEVTLDVEVPTVADRTRFLRSRLDFVGAKLKGMEALKKECDREAHRGAQRMATAGFGLLFVYWAGVARLTFWDFGWDVMEPITYLSGLSTVMAGYLWFLYQGREVSYSSILDRSISARRDTLYKARGFDIEHWMDLVTEGKRLRSEIRRISEDYEHRSKDEKEDEEKEEEEAIEGQKPKKDGSPDISDESRN
ncbi:Calcium uniporter protein 5, mitochondrial [Mycena sanguinolenta]|uniref:Calcium uniporter protein, mitochondrial n=1 Tax=Mycena sanguinolenta TaxID=230812 RepID=A0A8H6YTB2_9AGAR|nr:Calcium uniporter protein 5, mitochondrial [Mycena sanguinolenta]